MMQTALGQELFSFAMPKVASKLVSDAIDEHVDKLMSKTDELNKSEFDEWLTSTNKAVSNMVETTHLSGAQD